ncbi:adenosylcobinamide-GDP ribazoletransferase [Rhizocola hellebori]|uniref:Adenosylcobinamide-GDP ribazoletransferase n=1 Tax=Rhizocola hellebori TaxID=1392758 RepID=A0A8J3QEY2_9ACTN|nr:adenosylcobinamide-GDP ribazoletransferase [Rhizocola hellebori]GIH08777.1 adenosylcobinamide-GDP ribazoletransferase [Rhizocola hellebori]
MWGDGLRLALTTFTVAPIAAPSRIDRPTAAWAMRFAPLVGALLGLVLAGALYAMRAAGVPGLVAAPLTVGLAALLTRGMHLDGLADTVDALGSYRSPQRALEIMKSPETGAFAVAALVLTILVQSAAIVFLPAPALVAAVAAGRLAAAYGCQIQVPAARPEGLGALVAGTVGPVALGVNTAFVAALALWAAPERGLLALAAAAAVTAVLRWHLVKRLGGITGDVLGFLVEAATSVMLIALCIGAAPK